MCVFARPCVCAPPNRILDARFTRIYRQLMQVSLEYAKEHLADLVSVAYRGEEVEIAAPD